MEVKRVENYLEGYEQCLEVITAQTYRVGENHENLNLDNGRQMDSGIKFFGTILPHVLKQTKITCSFRKPLPVYQS